MLRSAVRSTCVLACLAVLAAGASALPASAAVTERVSVSSSEVQGNDISGRFAEPVLSDDGNFVAFDSQASNLVAQDTNGRIVDVFVRNRVDGTTELVSVKNNETQGSDDSTDPAISDDGRFVVFESDAILVNSDSNGVTDVYLRDRLNGTTARVSVASNGAQADAQSFGPAVSADGRFVAFVSDASNLVPDKQTIWRDVYVKDLQTGAVERVSLTDDEQEANSNSSPPDISADGRFVAFGSFASNLVPGDTNGQNDVFVRDRQLDSTERASVSSAEAEGDGASIRPALNADGRYVAFSSEATNLVPMDLNAVRDVFVRDRQAETTERVSVSSSEAEADSFSDGPGIRGGTAFGPDLSADGRLVVFDSIATNLVPDDTNTCEPFYTEPPGECPDVFVRDRTAGTTARANLAHDGSQGNRASTDPAISADGLTIAFFSSATNLVPGDTNTCPPTFLDPGECPDIFVRTQDQSGVDVGVTQTDSPDPVVVGQRVTYTVEVTNHGSSGATGVKLVDTLPRMVRFVSATPSVGTCSRVRRKVTCPVDSLGAGQSATVQVVVRTRSAGTISNRAVVSANEPDPNAANNSDTERTTVVPA